MTPIFRRLAVAALFTAAPAAAQTGFQDIEAMETQIVASLGAEIGEPGGPARPLDRRLRLKPCPEPVTLDAPAMNAVAVRCQSVGWRIRVPLERSAAVATAALTRAEPLIRRGDQVELVAMTANFSVSAAGIAEQDGAPGDRIRVRTEVKGKPAVIGQVMDDGRIALPGFN
ncbi:MAG: flagella basal body P-ring formation protein FlgA [Allosphingosinicella sp.]